MRSTAPNARPRIAVLDDEATIRKSMVRFLQANGVEAVGYASALEFLRACRDGAPDSAVIDCQMPELSGIQILERLRREGSALPVVILTAADDNDLSRTCAALGVRALLLKPVDGNVLLAAIELTLGEATGRASTLASEC